MKYLIFILLSFTASADNAIELDGDLNLVGEDATVSTNIQYTQEGLEVNLCIGLTLNGEDSGGGGGATNQGWDATGTTVALSGDNDEIATNPGSNNLSEYVISTTGHSSGYYYAEIKADVATSAQSAFGAVGSTASLSWLGGVSETVGAWMSGNTYVGGSITDTASLASRQDDVFRIWVRDGSKVWIEFHDGVSGTMIEGGDPETDTTPTATLTAGTIHIAYTPYGTSGTPNSATLRTTSSEFEYSSGTATAWDE